MLKANNQDNFQELRAGYPFFTYEGFEFTICSSSLHAEYRFNLADKFRFSPTLTIPQKPGVHFHEIPGEILENILFNIGMAELVSYWKCTCSPTIIIRNYILTEAQKSWWKKLYYNGLGEFRYLNEITAELNEFLEIKSEQGKELHPFQIPVREECLIPVGGGKDSVVTLELLRNLKGGRPFILNPRKATLETSHIGGFEKERIIEAHRTIDPVLLDLNKKGFLNGHTPFSALLAFIAVLSAILSGKKYVVLSNESSANEATIPGTNINHQYSKSVEFEKDFREYLTKFITHDIEYFSFLRPVNELQIASLFSGFPAYFPVFRSCNAGSKTDEWCGKCSKCLFTYIILSPFIEQHLLEKIFGSNLFTKSGLLPEFMELIGVSATKPFDCIGTIDEINAALRETLRKYTGTELPVLLDYYKNFQVIHADTNPSFAEHLAGFNNNHFLPASFEKILKSHLYA
ncbi:MAG: hypothetical protein NTX61_18165 [Bacteroidetes bacterium]|nr:hypothetical protein [Bacteroidota bacterium]